MKYSLIRKSFLDFFAENGHTIVPSSSIIPADDPTLLFANAGMNQFKDVFLGKEKRSYVRAASSQKCVRAGGKHNDLDQVGFTERHLTFFEMLGNFSFGDYFKRDAIKFAWLFLTKTLKLPADKLYPTVHTSDDEAAAIWQEVIGDPNKIITRLGDASNFWQMGDTGPCGPCTEIFYDRGEKYGEKEVDIGGENARYIEIWNLVFMQFNRQASGQLVPLTQTGVDTGAGLERIACVMQQKDNVFETDCFATLRAAISRETGINYETTDVKTRAAFNVLCDHARSTSLIIADGGMPSNDGRGYVLRKIIRRATLFAQKLGSPKIFSAIIPDFIKEYQSAFPELEKNASFIVKIITGEIDRFAESLIRGQEIFKQYVETQRANNSTQLSGEQLFKLYDTYGYPVELSQLMAQQDYNFTVDLAGFEKEMTKQREQSGAKAAVQESAALDVPADLRTTFVGYTKTQDESIITWCKHVGEQWFVVTEKTPFYVEAGGQVNDSGSVEIEGALFEVVDLKKIGGFTKDFSIVHVLEGVSNITLKPGMKILLKVNEQTRNDTRKNHTATHLLQAALINILGTHIKQAGSVVHPQYLRFDFVHFAPLTDVELANVEEKINEQIRANITLDIKSTSLATAQKDGVIAFFGEKYDPENVRTVAVPGVSQELCGGTHVRATGDIGSFKIVSDVSIANGVRRITAYTGRGADKLFRSCYATAKKLSDQHKVPVEQLESALDRQAQQLAHAHSEIKQLRKTVLAAQLPFWLDDMHTEDGASWLIHFEKDLDMHELKEAAEMLSHRREGIYVLLSQKEAGDVWSFVIFVSKGLQETMNLAPLTTILKQLGLKCGGKPFLLQGGGVIADKTTFKNEVGAHLSSLWK